MTLSFDGHDLESIFTCGDPEISILNATPDLRDVGGRHGSAFAGLTYGNSTVAFTIAAIGTALERRNALSTLGSWLMVSEPKQLVLPDTPDRYYLAVPSGPLELQRGIGSEIAKVTFTLTDPTAYGETKTVSLPSASSIQINVNGTAPTYLNVLANSAVRNSSALVWGVKVDNQDFAHVATGSSSARKVEIYCADRVCKLQNAITLPTLDSDWLELEPGTHTVTMDYGTGAATLSWVERWY